MTKIVANTKDLFAIYDDGSRTQFWIDHTKTPPQVMCGTAPLTSNQVRRLITWLERAVGD